MRVLVKAETHTSTCPYAQLSRSISIRPSVYLSLASFVYPSAGLSFYLQAARMQPGPCANLWLQVAEFARRAPAELLPLSPCRPEACEREMFATGVKKHRNVGTQVLLVWLRRCILQCRAPLGRITQLRPFLPRIHAVQLCCDLSSKTRAYSSLCQGCIHMCHV